MIPSFKYVRLGDDTIRSLSYLVTSLNVPIFTISRTKDSLLRSIHKFKSALGYSLSEIINNFVDEKDEKGKPKTRDTNDKSPLTPILKSVKTL